MKFSEQFGNCLNLDECESECGGGVTATLNRAAPKRPKLIQGWCHVCRSAQTEKKHEETRIQASRPKHTETGTARSKSARHGSGWNGSRDAGERERVRGRG